MRIGWIVDGNISAAPPLVAKALVDGVRVVQLLEDIADVIETEEFYPSDTRDQLPGWLSGGLYRYALPHPDIAASDWLRAARWLVAPSRRLREDYGIAERLDSLGGAAGFTVGYNELLVELSRPMTVTLPGHAWMAAHRAIREVFRINVQRDADRGRLPDRLRNELREVPSLSWRSLAAAPA